MYSSAVYLLICAVLFLFGQVKLSLLFRYISRCLIQLGVKQAFGCFVAAKKTSTNSTSTTTITTSTSTTTTTASPIATISPTVSSFATSSDNILRTEPSTARSGTAVAGSTGEGITSRTPEGTRKNADLGIHHTTGEWTHDNIDEGLRVWHR